jgi:hypothetical protein
VSKRILLGGSSNGSHSSHGDVAASTVRRAQRETMKGGRRRITPMLVT